LINLSRFFPAGSEEALQRKIAAPLREDDLEVFSPSARDPGYQRCTHWMVRLGESPRHRRTQEKHQRDTEEDRRGRRSLGAGEMSTTFIEVLRLEDDLAHRQLWEALDGVTPEEAWAVPPKEGRDYLHTDGSILAITQHVAVCLVMYGSAAFRDGEIRWSDCAARMDEVGTDWEKTLAHLREAHAYWRGTWGELRDEELTRPVKTNWGAEWPAWRVLATMSQHATYHAGQIALLKAVLSPAVEPTAWSSAGDIRHCCKDSPFW
jgi:hypothetical protein